MSSSVLINIKKKDILILGKGPAQGFEHTLIAEKLYSINFTLTKNKFLFELVLQWSKQLFICKWYRNLQIQSKRFCNCGNSIMFRKDF